MYVRTRHDERCTPYYIRTPRAPVDFILSLGSLPSQNHVKSAVARQQGRGNPLHPCHPRAQILQSSSVAGGQFGTAIGKLVGFTPAGKKQQGTHWEDEEGRGREGWGGRGEGGGLNIY